MRNSERAATALATKSSKMDPPRTSQVLLLIACLSMALQGCVAKPKAQYSPAQMAKIDSVEEIMRVLYHELNPIWKMDSLTSISANHKELLMRASQKVEASAAVLSQKIGQGRPPDFIKYARQLQQQAGQLGQAAEKQQAAQVRGLITALGNTCEACHGQFQ